MGSTSIATRSNEVDVIRMAALIGICIVNVPFMALPPEAVFISPESWYDKLGAFLVESLFQLKFFILFSFIFGWGMSIQARSAQAKSLSFRSHYFRRMAGLALLGVMHAILVFSGDILVLYAVLGMILWLAKDLPSSTLVKIAFWMLPVSVFSLIILAFAIDWVVNKGSVLSTSVGATLGGGFLEATQVRLSDWPFTLVFLLFLQGPLAFGAFVLGLAAGKSSFFDHGSTGFSMLKKKLPFLLSIALPLNLFYAAVVGGLIPESNEVLSLLGFVLIGIGAPALSAVYLYFFTQLARKLEIPKLLTLAGRNSLSVYIVQGILAGFVFGAYGLGFFNTLGLALLIPLSLLIALSAMLCVGIYASVFKKGPLEYLLRWISG